MASSSPRSYRGGVVDTDEEANAAYRKRIENLRAIRREKRMAAIILTAAVLYAVGFFLMLAVCAQLPNTIGLALVRSAAWPVSVVLREVWPRGQPQPMD